MADAEWVTEKGRDHLARNGQRLCDRVPTKARPLPAHLPGIAHYPRCATCAAIGPSHYVLGEIVDLGATARQVRHWTNRGWLHALRAHGRRVFTAEEAAVVDRALSLIRQGYRTEVALTLARGQSSS